MRGIRREILPVALILLAAIAFRVVYLLQYRAQIPYFSVPIVDSHVYDAWAQRVAAGEGYGARPFYMAPLYPYLLALLFKIAGHKLVLVYVFQAVLGVANLLLVYILGRRIFGRRSGLIAMVLLMLYAPLVYLETKLLTETLAVTLNLASILLVMRALDRPSAGRFLIAGLMLGLSIICRPAAGITAALVIGWLVWREYRPSECGGSTPLLPASGGVEPPPEKRCRATALREGSRGLAAPALILLGIAATILPITVRNYVVGRDFALISTNGGIVFAQGNNSGSRGLFTALPGFSASVQTEPEESAGLASKALGHPAKPSEVSSYWFRYGLQFIRESPGGYALLLLRKLSWSLHNGESACIYNVYIEKQLAPALRMLFLPFSVLIALGLYGIALSVQGTGGRDARLLGLTVLSVFLSLMIFSVSSRYRVPVSAPLAVFAGFGLSTLIGLIGSRDLRGLGIAAGCIAPVLLISLVPYPKAYITSEAPANLGMAYFVLGRDAQATAQLEQAVEMRPGFAYARVFLGRALARQERYDEAIVHYEKALDRQPENAEAHYLLGYALAQVGRSEEAIRQYEECLRLKPDYSIARSNLGAVHANLAIDLYEAGRYNEAWAHVRQARKYGVEAHPEFLKALSEKTRQ